MRPRSVLLAIAILVLLRSAAAYAQPSVDVSIEVREHFHSLIFNFVQPDVSSMSGCHYNLFAADAAGKLSDLPGKGLSIATFFKPLSFIQIIASPLQHLARDSAKRSPRVLIRPKVFFRVLLSCPQGVDGVGEIFSLRIKTYKSGKVQTLYGLIKRMKYHMRYYEP